MGFLNRKREQPDDGRVEMVDESLREAVDWKPDRHALSIMIVLSVISFMVSLDACIIVTSLSVSLLSIHCYLCISWANTDHLMVIIRQLSRISKGPLLPRAFGSAQHISFRKQYQCPSSPPSPTSLADPPF